MKGGRKELEGVRVWNSIIKIHCIEKNLLSIKKKKSIPHRLMEAKPNVGKPSLRLLIPGESSFCQVDN